MFGILHEPSPVLFAGDPVGGRPQRCGAGAGVRPRQPAPGREEAGAAERAGFLIPPDVAPHVAGVGAERDDDAHPVIRVAVQVVDDVLAGVVRGVVGQPALEADVTVEVDERRHDRLAGQVDHGGAGRRLDIVQRSDRDDDALIDDQPRRLDRGHARAVDKPRAVVDDRGACRPRRFRRPARATGQPAHARDGSGQGGATGRAAHGSTISNSKMHQGSLIGVPGTGQDRRPVHRARWQAHRNGSRVAAGAQGAARAAGGRQPSPHRSRRSFEAGHCRALPSS